MSAASVSGRRLARLWLPARLLGLAALLASGCGGSTQPNLAIVPTAAVVANPPGLPVDPAFTQTAAGPASPLPPEDPPTSTPNETATATPVPSPSPTPAPMLRQLTGAGCCSQPFWSPDGAQVWFIDKPSAEAPAGIWGVGLDGGAPALVTERLGIYSPDYQYLAYPEGGQTYVERVSDGQRWLVPSEGRAVSFSPDSAWITWTAGQSGPPFDTARRQVWVSRVDGSQASQLQSVTGGGFSGWLSDGRMLLSGRPEPGAVEQVLWVYDLEDGSQVELARAERLRGSSVSPDGEWLAYQVTFSADPAANGLWVVNTHTLARQRLPVFGAFRWRDGSRLLVVPLEISRPEHQLWQFEAGTGQGQPLTDPAVTPFKIANGDWSVSPGGQHVAFVSAADHSIWTISLP